MKVIDFLRTANLEEIVDKISAPYANEEGFSCDDWRHIFYCDELDVSVDCPEECEYLEQGNCYEDAWTNGICNASYYECDCPYKIDRNEVFKRILKEWFNKEM